MTFIAREWNRVTLPESFERSSSPVPHNAALFSNKVLIDATSQGHTEVR